MPRKFLAAGVPAQRTLIQIKVAGRSERQNLPVGALRWPASTTGTRRRSPMEAQIYARDIMTKDPVTLRPDSPIREAIRCMIASRLRGVPVVDKDCRLIGV